jgi:hypothetical protein
LYASSEKLSGAENALAALGAPAQARRTLIARNLWSTATVRSQLG